MRSASAALTAAANSGTAAPALRLELADMQPHFQTVPIDAHNGTYAACLSSDGAVLLAALDEASGLFLYRSQTPGQFWPEAVVITADAGDDGGVGIVTVGTVSKLFWRRATTLELQSSVSSDGGRTWSAPHTECDPGARVCSLTAPDFSTLIFGTYTPGLSPANIFVARFAGGVWVYHPWPRGPVEALQGLGAVARGDGSYLIVLSIQKLAGGPRSITALTWREDTGYSVMTDLWPVDTAVGYDAISPALTLSAAGVYRLCFVSRQMDLPTLQVMYERAARSLSLDGVHWSDPVEDEATQSFGCVWLGHPAGELLLGAQVRVAPSYTRTAATYLDLTARIERLELVEREGASARLTVSVSDTDGTIAAAACLRPNAQLLLSQGFAGVDLVGTHLLYVQQWTVEQAADLRRVTIVAADRLTYLERAAREPRAYTSDAVSEIAACLVAAGGIEQPLAVDAAPQYGLVVPSFTLQANEQYVKALARLLAIYDGSFRVEARAGAGAAFGYLDRLRLAAKSAGDAVAWQIGQGVQSLLVTRRGDRANRVCVYWSKVAGSYVEQVDFADIDVVGQDRYAAAVDSNLASEANAAVRAALELAREKRLAVAVDLTCAPQPLLELLDVAQVRDRQGVEVPFRVGELRLSVIPPQARFELRVLGGGV